jgi:pyruvate carboxylase subunit B
MSTYVVTIAGKEYTVSWSNDQIQLDGKPISASIETAGNGAYSVLENGASFRVISCRNGTTYEVLCDGISEEVRVETERSRLLRNYSSVSAQKARVDELRAPMPALVVRVEVEAGQEVVAGQGLVVLEAMKMENELKATHAGRVKEVRIEKGKAVEKGELLLVLE